MIVLNPRRRRRGTRRRLSPKALRNIRRAARRRVRTRRATARRHGRALERGEVARRVTQRIACAPDSLITSLRRRFGCMLKQVSPGVWRSKASDYASNPSALGAVTAGFSPGVIMDVLPMPIAGFANNWLQNKVASKFGITSWYGRGLVGIATSGVLGATAGMLKKDLSVPVGVGAAAQTLIQAFRDFQASRVVAAPPPPPVAAPATATVAAAATAPAKLSEFDGDGLADDMEGFEDFVEA